MSNLRTYILAVFLLIFGWQIPAKAHKWEPNCAEKWPACSKGTKPNIVCERSTCGPVRPHECYELYTTTEFRKRSLKLHNEYRDYLASGEEKHAGVVSASDMHLINYDFGLEYTAICNANTCVMEHDQCRATKRFSQAGQNLASKGQAHLELSLDRIDRFVQMWYNEVQIEDFTMPIDSWAHFPGAGHLTQLVWAKSTHIGCGWTIENKTNPDYRRLFYSCNYGPVGNFPGMPVYQRGAPCANCPSNESCGKKFTHLCGEEDGKNLEGPNPYHDYPNSGTGTGTTFGICGAIFVAMVGIVLWANYHFD